MGLDMYLHRQEYVSTFTYDEHTKKQRARAEEIAAIAGYVGPICESGGLTVNVPVAYWRKANAIHAWFVRTVQNGVDDCGEYEVSKEQLSDLVIDCKLALNHQEASKDVLPTQGGFFFGQTNYGESYRDDLQDTIDQLEPLIGPEGKSYYQYHASW